MMHQKISERIFFHFLIAKFSIISLQTPMAFYPTWQTATAAPATTEQAWQNQFIQQIPQNVSAPPVSVSSITPLNSLDFQQVL